MEKKNEQIETEEGKTVVVDIRPWKKVTDYARNCIRVRMFAKFKDVEVEVQSNKVMLNQGSLQIIFDAYSETDWLDRWEMKAPFFFIKVIFDKYLFKHYTDKYRANVAADLNSLHTKAKNFLNQYRYEGYFKLYSWYCCRL